MDSENDNLVGKRTFSVGNSGWRSVLWSGVIPGIVSSLLIVWFINPIASFVWFVATTTLGGMADFWINRTIKQAAIGNVEVYSFINLMLLIVPLLAFNLVVITASSGALKKLTKLRLVIHKQFDSSVHVSNIVKYGFLSCGILGLLSGLHILVTFTAVLQFSATFHQRMNIVRPFIDDIRFYEFASDWALMNTITDYRAINVDLEAIAAANKINLPVPLLK